MRETRQTPRDSPVEGVTPAGAAGVTPLMPIGLFLDLWACHKQFLGMEKPKQTFSIDDIIPPGI